jgi:hypothetical protein
MEPESLMMEAKEYRRYAADCLRMAQSMRPELKAGLLKMAHAWEALAIEAERNQCSGTRKLNRK